MQNLSQKYVWCAYGRLIGVKSGAKIGSKLSIALSAVQVRKIERLTLSLIRRGHE